MVEQGYILVLFDSVSSSSGFYVAIKPKPRQKFKYGMILQNDKDKGFLFSFI